jgi:hypothetical protein
MTKYYSLDAASDTATLSLFDVPELTDIRDAASRCSALPRTIRNLRIDLEAARDIDDASADALIGLVRDWRRSRRGQVIVSGGAGKLTLLADSSSAPNRTPRASIALGTLTRLTRSGSAAAHADAALMGIFL